jgi:hypothetical protein
LGLAWEEKQRTYQTGQTKGVLAQPAEETTPAFASTERHLFGTPSDRPKHAQHPLGKKIRLSGQTHMLSIL